MSSGLEHYFQLDLNSTDDRRMILEEDDVKFLIHGYTDKVQFNKTGSLTLLLHSNLYSLHLKSDNKFNFIFIQITSIDLSFFLSLRLDGTNWNRFGK